MEQQKARCLQCRYYYITWDKGFPYGCKAMGFKSKNIPMLDVARLSGKICLSFAPKDGK